VCQRVEHSSAEYFRLSRRRGLAGPLKRTQSPYHDVHQRSQGLGGQFHIAQAFETDCPSYLAASTQKPH